MKVASGQVLALERGPPLSPILGCVYPKIDPPSSHSTDVQNHQTRISIFSCVQVRVIRPKKVAGVERVSESNIFVSSTAETRVKTTTNTRVPEILRKESRTNSIRGRARKDNRPDLG